MKRESSSADACGPVNTGVEVVFFDAVGTLIHLPRGAGYHYRLVAERHGLALDEHALNNAFRAVWKEMPLRPVSRKQRPDDDKGWWHELVKRVLVHCNMQISTERLNAYFEELYRHFTERGVWELYPEVIDVLSRLRQNGRRLAVISNFDGRLRIVLDQLGIGACFEKIIISSEAGADKPDPYIFQHAMELMAVQRVNALHIGDDPENDWHAAEAVGMKVGHLKRPANSLAIIPELLNLLQPGGLL